MRISSDALLEKINGLRATEVQIQNSHGQNKKFMIAPIPARLTPRVFAPLATYVEAGPGLAFEDSMFGKCQAVVNDCLSFVAAAVPDAAGNEVYFPLDSESAQDNHIDDQRQYYGIVEAMVTVFLDASEVTKFREELRGHKRAREIELGIQPSPLTELNTTPTVKKSKNSSSR